MASRLVRSLVSAAVVCASVSTLPRAGAQQIGHLPVDVQVPQPPAAAAALGRVHLVYEVHITNFGGAEATVAQLDVLDQSRNLVGSWSGGRLWQRIRVLGQPSSASTQVLAPGQRGIVHLWITLQPGASAPTALAHRLTLSRSGEQETITTTMVTVPSAVALIDAPVRGGPWVAVRGPSAVSGHRLSIVALGGRAAVPQRFAVDWTRLSDDGLPYRGDPTSVASWHGYDVPVYAVAEGAVVLVRDGRPDRPAFAGAPPPVMDAADAAGNVVVVDLGEGQFATYAHLKAGSMQVAEGDRVVRGQALARIGNSGNSLAPHLHFHVSDAPEPLAGEGLPFALRTFELIGRIDALSNLLAGTAWATSAAQPSRNVDREMPLENMVVRFPAGAGFQLER